jgi:glyoxylase I family protein
MNIRAIHHIAILTDHYEESKRFYTGVLGFDIIRETLRHLAFAVDNVEDAAAELRAKHVPVEPVRIDELTHKKFFFFTDPNGQPLELYEK